MTEREKSVSCKFTDRKRPFHLSESLFIPCTKPIVDCSVIQTCPSVRHVVGLGSPVICAPSFVPRRSRPGGGRKEEGGNPPKDSDVWTRETRRTSLSGTGYGRLWEWFGLLRVGV